MTHDIPLLQETSVFSVLSALLGYPEQALLDALPELSDALPTPVRQTLAPVFDHLQHGQDLIDLQEHYVATFDRRAAHSLHLFEHVHGESRDRGQAMVDLQNEYLKHGLAPSTTELPDYVPLFLEFLGQIPADSADALLGDAIHVLARLGDKLAESHSPYACIFVQLRSMTDVQPEALPEPPEGALEETMITFGPQAEGLETPAMLQPRQPRPPRPADGQPVVIRAPHRRPAGSADPV
ncbi:nitrate reductase molybdenum cofactor assembly chaperone [Castellaniella sp.]|uniref:nitrate reductase molybdenum cofactor assembly chaperone n=1 Tax=Castellaniella sp. TaxID=1955812 RepID=UPI003566B522